MAGYNFLNKSRSLRYKFNLNNSYPYFEMLEQQINGNIDSWAIRWYLSAFTINGMTLYPIRTLVKNIGFDGSGTHCGASLYLDTEMQQDRIFLMQTKVKVDYRIMNVISKYLWQLNQPLSLLQRAKQKIINYLTKNYAS
jgi:hypothetical protein